MNLHYKELAKSGLNLDGVLAMRQLFRFLEQHPEEALCLEDASSFLTASGEKLVSRVFGNLFEWCGDVIDEVINE